MIKNNKYETRLEEIMFTPRYSSYVECLKIGGIIIPMIKLKGYALYLYGYMEYMEGLILYLRQNKVKIYGIIAREYTGKGKMFRTDKIPVMAVSMIDDIPNKDNAFILIGQSKEAWTQSDIALLRNAGFKKYKTLSYAEKYQIDGEEWATMAGVSPAYHISYLRHQFESLKTVLNELKDDISKEVMLEWIRCYMERDKYNRKLECEGRHKYFLGLPQDEGYEALYTKKKDEVWLNCGSNIGDNIFLYFADGLDADIVFAVEGDKDIFKKLCRNIKRLPPPHSTKDKIHQ